MKMKKIGLTLFITCVSLIDLNACDSPSSYLKSSAPFMAATLKTIPQRQDSGQIYLRRVDNGIQVYGSLVNLPPYSLLGINIYRSGACINKGKLAGGYLNSAHSPLSHPDHLSKLTTKPSIITVNKQGMAVVNYVIADVAHEKQIRPHVSNQAVVVHTVTVNNEGLPITHDTTRIACGIMRKY